MFYQSHKGNSEGKAQNIHRTPILAIPQVLILYVCMPWKSDWSFFWVLLELFGFLGGFYFLLASYMSFILFAAGSGEPRPLGAGIEGSLHDGKEMTTSSFWETQSFTSWFHLFSSGLISHPHLDNHPPDTGSWGTFKTIFCHLQFQQKQQQKLFWAINILKKCNEEIH